MIELVIVGMLVVFFAGLGIGSTALPLKPKQLPPADPMESRLFPYLFLVETDPDGWEVQGTAFTGWTRYVHRSGRRIAIYKADEDVETDTILAYDLSEVEKIQLKKAVYKLQSLKTINGAIDD
jgi:hypothetical protein